MKLRALLLLFPAFLLALYGCQEKNSNTTTEEDVPEIWTKDAYSIEELVIMFQDWIPEEYLEGQVVWVCNVCWDDYKVTDPEILKPGDRYDPCHNDTTYLHPGHYMHNLVRTIRDTSFFQPAFYSKEPAVTISGDTIWMSVSSGWYEGMVVNYSGEKCARMLAELVTEYIEDVSMKPEWAEQKDRWLAELRKLEQS